MLDRGQNPSRFANVYWFLESQWSRKVIFPIIFEQQTRIDVGERKVLLQNPAQIEATRRDCKNIVENVRLRMLAHSIIVLTQRLLAV